MTTITKIPIEEHTGFTSNERKNNYDNNNTSRMKRNSIKVTFE